MPRVQLGFPMHHAPRNHCVLLGMSQQQHTSWALSLLAPSGPDPVTSSKVTDLAEGSAVMAPEPALVANTHIMYFTCLLGML